LSIPSSDGGQRGIQRAASDVLIGGPGDDQLYGFAGDDPLDGGTGTDHMEGGSGADTVDYSHRTAAVHVDLEGDADDGPAGEHDVVWTDVEHLLGGSGNDTLIGDAGYDKLYGDAGDDYLNARDGATDSVLDGGAGSFDKIKKDSFEPTAGIEQILA
jgi:Ca2+-binding RTX toxin-like protein